MAKALGWLSIGLGLAQTVAPDTVARLIGADTDARTRSIMRTVGARELISGFGILSRDRPARWMQARVAGDVMDLALLVGALQSRNGDRNRTTAAILGILGVGALDLTCAQQLESPTSRAALDAPLRHGIAVQRSITVNRPREEVYQFWHDFENLPRFMRHLEDVQVIRPARSRWKARAPAGMTVEWEAITTEDEPNEKIAWKSIEGSEVDNAGSVKFVPAPGGRGTEVHVKVNYRPPGGKITATLAKLFRKEPGQQLEDDLRAFKQVMEVGEVVVSDATMRRGRPHPARPSGEAS
jgi:uncharacterized membrane protein